MTHMTSREREIFENAHKQSREMNHSSAADSQFDARCDEPDVIRALVTAVAGNLVPLGVPFEERNGCLVLLDITESGSDYSPKLIRKCEYQHWTALHCNGRLLHYVAGAIYVVDGGFFLVVAGYPRRFGAGSREEDLVTELFYLGM